MIAMCSKVSPLTMALNSTFIRGGSYYKPGQQKCRIRKCPKHTYYKCAIGILFSRNKDIIEPPRQLKYSALLRMG
ncbi:MAG: hypothetical protein COA40_09250 [Aequorivita sp.]|nr:MAG: hypothetical protein COA40_09250 [Aequorivita sp.]